MQLHALDPQIQIFFIHFSVKYFFPPTNISRKIAGQFKASVWRNLSTGTAPKIC